MWKYSVSKGDFNSNCKTREVGDDESLLLLNAYMLQTLSSQLLLLLKLCIMYTLLHFLVCQSCRVVSGTYPWVARISPS